jgi:hypothetical protein
MARNARSGFIVKNKRLFSEEIGLPFRASKMKVEFRTRNLFRFTCAVLRLLETPSRHIHQITKDDSSASLVTAPRGESQTIQVRSGHENSALQSRQRCNP